MIDTYWQAISAIQVKLATVATVDEVLALCPRVPEVSSGAGWWGGDGDDMLGALYDAGWTCVEYRAPYHWCLRAPKATTGSRLLTYTEGDLDRGNQLPRSRS